MPFCFLHLTDTHLPPEGELLYGRDPGPRLAAVLADVAARHGPGGAAPAAFAVVTGDLVRDGEPAAYGRLRSALAALPFPTHLLLGNHDDRPAYRAAFADRPTDPNGFAQHAFDSPAGRCVLLDTHAAGQSHGTLCDARLGWLAHELAGTTGPVLLFMHHPPFPIGMAAMDAIGLRDADALWAVLRPHAPRLRHLFFGHVHRPVAGNWHGIPVSSHGGTAFRIPLEFGLGPVRPTGLEPPDYAVVRLEATGLIVLMREVMNGASVAGDASVRAG